MIHEELGENNDDVDKHSHPEIPSHGVSTDIHVEIQFGDKSEDVHVGRELEDGVDFAEFEDMFGSSFVDDEADSMTHDKDTRRKERELTMLRSQSSPSLGSLL